MRPFASTICVFALAFSMAGYMKLREYGKGVRVGNVEVAGGRFFVLIHPSRDSILVQRSAGGSFKQQIIEGSTMNLVDAKAPDAAFRQAAASVVEAGGCEMSTLTTFDEAMSVEVGYHCPPDIDLRAIWRDRSSANRR